MKTSVAIVTAWHNHPELADGYWTAIEAGSPDQVIIVDNGSDPPIDGAAVRFEENLGFCAANNAGLRTATTDAVVFLNNDVELRRPSWLDEIRAKLGPKRLVGQIRHEGWAVVDGVGHPYVDGWCVAALREDLLELGGWDESLAEPAYYSDNMLTLRAAQADWEVAPITPGLRHLGGGTARDDMGRINLAANENRDIWVVAVRASQLVTTT